MTKRLRSLLRTLFRRTESDRLLDEELKSCADILADEKRAEGLDSVEARRQAHVELGGIEQIRTQVREGRMGAALESVWFDVRYAVRTLLQAKGWTAIIIVSLGLGIGVNTIMFSLVNGLFLRTLPVSNPSTLVRLRWTGPADLTGVDENTSYSNSSTGHPLRANFSAIVVEQLGTTHQTLSDLFACAAQQVVLFTNGESRWEDGLLASGNYYESLGVHALLGRTFTEEDDKTSAPAVAVISYAYWASRFGKDPQIVGTKVLANDVPVTIIGVTPRDFIGVQNLTDGDSNVTFPMALSLILNHRNPKNQLFFDSIWNIQLMARLNPGVTLVQAQGNLNTVFQSAAAASWAAQLAAMPPAMRILPQIQNRTRLPSLLVESGRRGLFDPDQQTIRAGAILIMVVVLVMLIVCGNVANLMLARSATRRREISARLALGAMRMRLVRQLLTESLVLALAGGALGLAVNHWGRTLIPSFRSVYVAQDLPVVNIGLMPELDWRIFFYVFGLTLLTGAAFGLVPAFRATRINLASDLKAGGRSISGERSFLSKGLLIAQVAISLTLLVGAGLFLGTVRNLRNVSVGFNPHNVLSFHLSLRATTMGVTLDSYHVVYDHIIEKVAELPGVRSVGATGVAYWQSQVIASIPIFAEGAAAPVAADVVDASAGFFETLEIPLLAGRAMNFLDLAAVPKAVWINELAARRFFPGQDPLGRRMGGNPANAAAWQIAGVVGNTKFGDVRDPFKPTIYLPRPQTSFVVRTNGDPMKIAGNVIDIVRQIDPRIAVTDTETEDSLLDGRIQTERLYASFYAFFGGIALALASIGLFGLMSYSVARRTSEIGVRMALGAQRSDVVRQVLLESLTLAGIGVGIGILASLAAARLIASQLYGMAPHDLPTFAAAIGVMFVVSGLAGYLPARRASSIDPLRALRHE